MFRTFFDFQTFPLIPLSSYSAAIKVAFSIIKQIFKITRREKMLDNGKKELAIVQTKKKS